jgi:hypothetical protein
MNSEKVWVRSHRTMGYEIARATTDDDRKLIIIQTDEHKQEAVGAYTVMPVSQKELEFDVRMLLIQAILRARFLGIDNETIERLMGEELAREGVSAK